MSVLNQPPAAQNNTVQLAKLMLILGVIDVVFWSVLSAVMVFCGQISWVLALFLLFILLGASLIIGYCNCRIHYDDAGFAVKSFWGMKRRYSYGEITAIEGKYTDVKICVGSRVIKLEQLFIGKTEFVAFAKKKYRAAHDRQEVASAVPVKRHDIYNGNIERSGNLVFGYVLGYVVGALFLVLIILCIFQTPKSPDDLTYIVSPIDRYEKSNNNSVDLFIHDEKYTISNTEEVSYLREFFNACENGATFRLGVSKQFGNQFVESITDENNRVYLAFEYNEQNGQAAIFCLVLAGGILLYFIISFPLSIYIGRHSERYSDRVLKLFFKLNYVKYRRDSTRKR